MLFFDELKRRNVFRVSIAYIIIAWLLMQVGDTMGPALLLPDWVNSALAFFLVLGFPLALFFAWAFELTPEGLKKEKEIDRSESITPGTGRKLDFAIIGLLAVALVYFVWESRFENDDGDATATATQTEQLTEQPKQAPTRLSIAVLPFENRSNREEDQFFTDGIHDDLLTTIAKIGSMKVISRTSVMEYRNTTKKIPEIAKELGVSNILEGGIQRSGNQVRINVQLIDAVTDEHLWAEIYDRELTAENLFGVQSEISKSIADALQATLSPAEVRRIDAMPTDNLLAFDAYLRGRRLMATRNPEKLELAIKEFNKAVELDPKFALAWVGVADSNRLFVSYGTLSKEDSFPIREEAINRALAIDDKLGEAYTSLGSLYSDKGQNEEAEAAYKRAIQLSPNYATAWQWYADIAAQDSQRADEAIELTSKAAELDPRSSIISMNLANRYRSRGLFAMAERQYLKMIDLDPGFLLGIRTLVGFYMRVVGRYDQAMVYALRAQELEPERARNLGTVASIYLNLDDFSAAEIIRDRMSDLDADSRGIGQIDIEINLFKNNLAAARNAVDLMLSKFPDNPRGNTYLAFYMLASGDKTRARELYLSANPGWLDPEQSHSVSILINDGCIVSWILINTGDVELGQQLLQQSTAAFDETMRARNEHIHIYYPEICYLTAGDTEKALQSIEKQLAHHHLYDWKLIHHLPMYDLIRDEPRYQAALQERERIIAAQRQAIANSK